MSLSICDWPAVCDNNFEWWDYEEFNSRIKNPGQPICFIYI